MGNGLQCPEVRIFFSRWRRRLLSPDEETGLEIHKISRPPGFNMERRRSRAVLYQLSGHLQKQDKSKSKLKINNVRASSSLDVIGVIFYLFLPSVTMMEFHDRPLVGCVFHGMRQHKNVQSRCDLQAWTEPRSTCSGTSQFLIFRKWSFKNLLSGFLQFCISSFIKHVMLSRVIAGQSVFINRLFFCFVFYQITCDLCVSQQFHPPHPSPIHP